MVRLCTVLIAIFCWPFMTTAGADPYFKHLGMRLGLAHPSVMSICQDSLGRIWFGTENGVSVFDGNRVTSCKPYDLRGGSVAFKGSVVKPLVCDSKGNVFFLTEHEWVMCDVRTGAVNVLMEGPITALYIRDGEAHAVRGRESYRWNPATAAVEPSGSLPFDGVRDYLVDSRGRHWLICPEGLFRTSEDGQFVRETPQGDLMALYESSRGDIWTGSNNDGLFRMMADGKSIHYTKAEHSSQGFQCDNLRSVAEDGDGRIWFGTLHGLHCYDPEEGRFRRFEREDREGGLSQSSVHSILVDGDGTLWAGTYYGGVNYTDTRSGAFSFYPAAPSSGGLSHPVVGHLAHGSDGCIWICTEGGGVNWLDTREGKIHLFRDQPFTHAKWLCEDPGKGILYVGTNRQGLYCLDIATGHSWQELRDDGDGCSPRSVVNVVNRHGDELYLSTDDGVFLHSCKTKKDSLVYPRTEDIRYVHAIIRGDELWLASSTVVVFDLRKKKVKAEYPIISEGARVRPMRLLATEDGSVLASTFGQGIFHLTGGKFIPLTGPRVNPSGYQMVEAGAGRLLVSGENGLQLLDRSGRTLQSWPLGSNLPLNALVMDSGLLALKDGTVYVGSTNGLLSFRIGGESVPVPGGDIYFSELYVDGNPVRAYDNGSILSESLPFTRGIRLKGPQTRIDVYLSARRNLATLNWTDYEYRLKGRDSRWNAVEGLPMSLVDLPVGDYALQVRRIQGDGDVLCSMDIDVRPYWWATWWARLAYLLLAGALASVLLRVLWLRRQSALAVEAEREEKARLQEINETKLRFFTAVSHELRSPLTLIIAQIDSIFRTFRLPPRVHHKMSKAMDQAQQMNEIVTELIDFRKYEQDMMRLRVSKANVGLLAGDMVSKYADLASSKGLSLEYIAPEMAPQVYIDPYQMQKVLRNLIFNAIKYTPNGGRIALAVEPTDDGGAAIHVRDNGIGIAEEDCRHIFDRFYQVDNRDSGGIGGSGIGLALVKDIVERHGGSVSVSSKLGEGSGFTVLLKGGKAHFEEDGMVEIEEDGQPIGAAIHPASPGRDSIVIAEDNPEMLEILKELFSVGYNVYCASDGREALDLVKDKGPDIVLCDVMMPVMDGNKLCSAIKSDPLLEHIPVVMLTALTDAEHQLSGLQKGADDYIAKPFQSRMLLTRCNNLVRARKRSSSGGDRLSTNASNSEDKWFTDKISSIMEDHAGNAGLDIDTMADMVHMSRSSFYTRFKSVTGETPNEYVTSYRLRRACDMLLDDRHLPIADIASKLGFSSQAYFCRRFKAAYGMSPSDYRRSR